MNLTEAHERWMASPGRYHWPDDAVPQDVLRDAFAVGWNAARPPITGTWDGTSHNAANQPGELKVTLHGHTGDGQPVDLEMDEAAAVRLRRDLDRFGVGL